MKKTTTSHSTAIIIARSEHQRLLTFAGALEARDPQLADVLFGELERANVVDDAKIGSNVVRIGSTVRYEANGEEKTVTLVYPPEADISQGKISVLTPIGTALLGLSPEQSLDWTDRNGRKQTLKVIEVSQAPAES